MNKIFKKLVKCLTIFLNGIGDILYSISSLIFVVIHKLKKYLEGEEIECRYCNSKFKICLDDLEEDEYEEPYGGFSTYLICQCPNCKKWTEPNAEIYKKYYKK